MGLMQRFRGAKVRSSDTSDEPGARGTVTLEWDPIGTAFERRSRPEQMARIQSANREAALCWADAVRAGTMSRAQFDLITRQAVRTRQLLPDHLEEALARLEG
jgi:hypothetical protein